MQTLYIHPQNPQARLIDTAVNSLRAGKIIIAPTRLGYAFIIAATAKDAPARLAQLTEPCDFAIACADISAMSGFAELDNEQFFAIKTNPNAVFALTASKGVPKKIAPNKTIQLYIDTTPIITALSECLGESLAVVWIDSPFASYELAEAFAHGCDAMIDVGDLPNGERELIYL